jgi:hypothetical protein
VRAGRSFEVVHADWPGTAQHRKSPHKREARDNAREADFCIGNEKTGDIINGGRGGYNCERLCKGCCRFSGDPPPNLV